jgi:hypothetical protein
MYSDRAASEGLELLLLAPRHQVAYGTLVPSGERLVCAAVEGAAISVAART